MSRPWLRGSSGQMKAAAFAMEVHVIMLRLVTAFMRSSGDEGILILDQAGFNEIAVVDKQALLDVASPPRADESRLQNNLELFCDIVRVKRKLRKVESDGRVHVSASDISDWKSGRVQ